MKILLLNDAATPGGGAELLTLALRHELRRRGHDARLFASTAAYGPGPSQADYTCYGTVGALRTIHRVGNFSAYVRLRSVLRDFRPDVVHVRMFLTQLSPLILPLLRDVPSLYHATWFETICPTGLKLLPDGAVCNEPAGRACRRNGCVSRRAWPGLMWQLTLFRHWRGVFDRVVANSQALAQTLTANGLSPVEVIWNGVEVRASRPPLVSPPTISFAGRLSREKGVDVLLRAFAQVRESVPDAKLVIVGDGNKRDELLRLSRELALGASVEMLGHLEQGDLERQLAASWVHAVPSWPPETFGLTAAEAMMRGTAVVASSVGGLVEIVEAERTGLLVPPGDERSLGGRLAARPDGPGAGGKHGRRGPPTSALTIQSGRFRGQVRRSVRCTPTVTRVTTPPLDCPVAVLPAFLRRRLGLRARFRVPYDDLVRIRLGEDAFMLTDATDIRHVLLDKAGRYDKTPRLTGARGKERAGRGLLTSRGLEHRRQRLLMQPLFHQKVVERFNVVVEQQTVRALERWRVATTIDIAKEMADLALSILIGVLFGSDFRDESGALANAIRARRRYTEYVYHSRLPFRESLPSPTVRANQAAMKTLDRIIYDAIATRRASGAVTGDMVSLLMQATYADGSHMSDGQVRDEVPHAHQYRSRDDW